MFENYYLYPLKFFFKYRENDPILNYLTTMKQFLLRALFITIEKNIYI